jgi:uncharacterized membrane protein (UPF0127 family)
MYKTQLAILGVLCVTLGILIGFQWYYNNQQQTPTPTSLSVTLPLTQLEIANTPALRAKGLMERTSICDSCGMLFVFDNEQVQSFWMKNTPLPLDMIFMDTNGNVNTIHRNTVPNQEFPTYSSTKPSKYVLEVPAGWSDKHNIKEQTIVNIYALQRQ